jgi:hypothetical protein
VWNFYQKAMSEFKFACPVCGQHITADSSTTGSQLECPTCFQKIVVPQAPAADSPKFIIAASQVSKPREFSNGQYAGSVAPAPVRKSLSFAAFILAVLCAAGAGWIAFRSRVAHTYPTDPHGTASTPGEDDAKTAQALEQTAKVVHPIPTNIEWTLELTNAVFPETLAAGSIHGSGFLCERATLQGGNLTLRQGKSGLADLGISIYLSAQQGEELASKIFQVPPHRPPPLPKVVLRWKDEQDKPVSKSFSSGYALKLEFGQVALGRIPGKVYVCLPDENKSFVAGTFDAQIRKPSPPKSKPKQPKASP